MIKTNEDEEREFLDEKISRCIQLMRELVSNVQGAPYPGEDINKELYYIWYEHAQKAAVDCFRFLDEYFPEEEKKVDNDIDNLIETKH